jgi:hypothetical protein
MPYQLTAFDTILRLADGASIPPDTGNRDYQEYLGWVAEGNTPEPAPAPPVDTSPKFDIFLNQILASNLYQAVVAQAITNPIVNTGLTVTMGALLLAAGGSPNIDGLQAGINLLFSGLTVNLEHLVELEAILAASKLTDLVTIPPVK